MKIETILKELYAINQLPIADQDDVTKICIFHMIRMGFGVEDEYEFDEALNSNFTSLGQFEKKIAPFIKTISPLQNA